MKILIQKSLEANVIVDDEIKGKINSGLVLFVGFNKTDTTKIIDKMINKVINLRIFEDESGIMNRSLLDVGGSILSISQFTLYANTANGRRPSYTNALCSSESIKLYNLFNEKLKDLGLNVETGVFGADMKVTLTNNGPTTILIDSEDYINDKK